MVQGARCTGHGARRRGKAKSIERRALSQESPPLPLVFLSPSFVKRGKGRFELCPLLALWNAFALLFHWGASAVTAQVKITIEIF